MDQPGRYLTEDPAGQYTGQITRLLRDESTDNCPLLLELITGGGVNHRLLGYLFGIACFHHRKEVADRAMNLLSKNAMPATTRQAQKLKESAAYYYNEVEYLGKYSNPDFDLFDFLLAYKMCNWHRVGEARSHYFITAHQTLNLSQYPENQLSPALATLDFVHYLALPAHKGFDLMASLVHLEQLPLESIFIENTRLDEFPVALFQLPQLRILSIKRGSFRPKQPMLVPEGGPFGSPVLEKLIIDGYPLVGEMRLGPFPRLREALFLRCALTNMSFLENAPLIEHIALKNNHLETLPSFLGDCTELRILDLSGNPFRKIELNLERLVRLEELDLKMQPQQAP